MRPATMMAVLASLSAACDGRGLDDDARGDCGNGVVEGAEGCDLGIFNNDAGACTTDCQRQRCGDGVQGVGEECDDGAANSNIEPYTCRTSCRLPVLCPNGLEDEGEECDDGNDDDD